MILGVCLCVFVGVLVESSVAQMTVDDIPGLTAEGKEIKGGTPTVDDSADGKLVVKWPTVSPKGEVVLTFNEKSVSIRAAGMKDGWYLELSSDKKAELPFGKIGRKKISCNFKDASYTISAKCGEFKKESGSGLRIVSKKNRIVLDFSSR